MDIKKQKEFNAKMGKRKKSQGGLIKRIGNIKYFDDGGTVLSGPSNSVVSGNPRTVNNNGLVGTVGNELGLNNQFQAGSANIQAGTNAAQLNNAYTQTQNALGQQQGIVNTLNPGVNQGVASQANLTGMLTNQANGVGPNPAQAALNQATGQNVSNQAALMAGQRGAGSNVGLIARQAAQQGAATQQGAVGQAATLQAEQQLAAEQNLQNLAATQVGQGQGATSTLNEAQQNEQNILQGANTAYNNAGVAMQSNINNVNAQIAAANQNQATNILGGIANAGSSLTSGITGMMAAKGGEVHNMDEGGMAFHSGSDSSSGPAVPATGTLPANTTNLSQVGKSGGGGGSEVSAILPLLASAAHGGMMRRQFFASGGYLPPTNLSVAQTNAPGSFVGHFLTSNVNTGGAPSIGASPSLPEYKQADWAKQSPSKAKEPSDGTDAALASKPAPTQAGDPVVNPNEKYVSKGGAMKEPVEAMVSAGERYLSPDEVKKVVHEGADPTKLGSVFKGKAKVKGDSLKNDTIHKSLDEGGVVIPRHITQMKGPGKSEKSELFVRRAVHMHSPGRNK